MKSLFMCLSVFVLSTTTLFSQSVIAKWDFEDSTLDPTIGEGSIQLIGTCADYDGNAWVTGNPGIGFNTSNYPEQGTGTETSGIELTIENPDHLTDLRLHFDKRNSNTASKWFTIYFSYNDGQSWVQPNYYEQTEGGVWEHFSIELGASADEAQQLRIKIMSAFDENNHETYNATDTTSEYGSGGTFRYDNIILTSGPLLGATDLVVEDLSINTVWNDKLLVKSNSTYEFTLYDLSGRKILSDNGIGNQNFFVGNISKGNYILTLKIKGENKTRNFKIVKR